MSVVFPLPFGPRRPSRVPGLSTRLASSTMRRSPNRLPTCSATTRSFVRRSLASKSIAAVRRSSRSAERASSSLSRPASRMRACAFVVRASVRAGFTTWRTRFASAVPRSRRGAPPSAENSLYRPRASKYPRRTGSRSSMPATFSRNQRLAHDEEGARFGGGSSSRECPRGPGGSWVRRAAGDRRADTPARSRRAPPAAGERPGRTPDRESAPPSVRHAAARRRQPVTGERVCDQPTLRPGERRMLRHVREVAWRGARSCRRPASDAREHAEQRRLPEPLARRARGSPSWMPNDKSAKSGAAPYAFVRSRQPSSRAMSRDQGPVRTNGPRGVSSAARRRSRRPFRTDAFTSSAEKIARSRAGSGVSIVNDSSASPGGASSAGW